MYYCETENENKHREEAIMGITKSQHYVSKGVLKHFADEHKKIFELYIDKGIISKKAIDGVMTQNYAYEHPTLETNSLENFFAQIESRLISWLDKVLDVLESQCKEGADCNKYINDLKRVMPLFLMFYFRSGALLYEYSFSSENPKLERVERLIFNIFDDKYIRGLCKTVNECYETAILVDEQERFLISDQYLSTVALKYKNKFSNASNRQIGMKDTMILLPLSAKFYVAFFQGRQPEFIVKDKFNFIDDSAVYKINSIIFQNSYVKCAGKEQQLLENVRDEVLTTYSPTKCIMQYKDGTIKDFITKKEVFWYDEDRDLNDNSIQYMGDYLQKIKGKIGRNDLCICGSGKKYKYCCQRKYELSNAIYLNLINKEGANYNIPGCTMHEEGIQVYAGKIENFKNKEDKDILERMQKITQEYEAE